MKTFLVQDSDFKTPDVKKWKSGKHVPCVSVAIRPEGVAVRSTLDEGKTTVFFNKREWTAFIGAVKAGEFERS
ncbi:MAG: hypothetical protein A3B88_00810 [Candidatus Zambryskibacteria bacterium RIFCSPHIGHO2_02_FULL_39_19]|nr:MAG: hypothetical protein A3B88_00810 [Candidatus Zambryskibacteria bacterium RIFCSPHIGHO2_02_FULL_39_19]